MLITQGFTGVRSELAESALRTIRKSWVNYKSPIKTAIKRTSSRELVAALCTEASDITTISTADAKFSDGNTKVGKAASKPTASATGSLCGDGLFAFERDIRKDHFKFLQEKDRSTQPVVANISLQPEIRWEMRKVLMDFIIQVHMHYKLRNESLHLAVNILDRYMSRAVVLKKHYQLVGMTCLWLAAKFEDGQERVPRASMLCSLCCNLYDENSFVTMERHILKTLDWDLGHPTTETFLQSSLLDSFLDDKKLRFIARYLTEVTLYECCFVSMGREVVANACLYYARRVLQVPQKLIDEDDERYPCVVELDKCLRLGVSTALRNKHSQSIFLRASTWVENWLNKKPFFPLGSSFIGDPFADSSDILGSIDLNVDKPLHLLEDNIEAENRPHVESATNSCPEQASASPLQPQSPVYLQSQPQSPYPQLQSPYHQLQSPSHLLPPPQPQPSPSTRVTPPSKANHRQLPR